MAYNPFVWCDVKTCSRFPKASSYLKQGQQMQRRLARDCFQQLADSVSAKVTTCHFSLPYVLGMFRAHACVACPKLFDHQLLRDALLL